jgi:hypothetical protein
MEEMPKYRDQAAEAPDVIAGQAVSIESDIGQAIKLFV